MLGGFVKDVFKIRNLENRNRTAGAENPEKKRMGGGGGARRQKKASHSVAVPDKHNCGAAVKKYIHRLLCSPRTRHNEALRRLICRDKSRANPPCVCVCCGLRLLCQYQKVKSGKRKCTVDICKI